MLVDESCRSALYVLAILTRKVTFSLISAFLLSSTEGSLEPGFACLVQWLTSTVLTECRVSQASLCWCDLSPGLIYLNFEITENNGSANDQ